jgi:hypothetical protein
VSDSPRFSASRDRSVLGLWGVLWPDNHWIALRRRLPSIYVTLHDGGPTAIHDKRPDQNADLIGFPIPEIFQKMEITFLRILLFVNYSNKKLTTPTDNFDT